jgi:excinuclease UvrABC helicase subunit UvrB
MTHIKMSGDLYDDVKNVNEGISYLTGMIETLEKECMVRDKDKPATELFIRINSVKEALKKIASEYEHILYRADIDQFGPLSKYVRPYLGS